VSLLLFMSVFPHSSHPFLPSAHLRLRQHLHLSLGFHFQKVFVAICRKWTLPRSLLLANAAAEAG